MHSSVTEEVVAKFDDIKAYAQQEGEVFVSHNWSDPNSSRTDSL